MSFITVGYQVAFCSPSLPFTETEIGANGMGSFLVPFGGLDPMRDLWLPWILSDQLIFASSLLRASAHLSALNSTADTESSRWRGVTLSLLNSRLASSSQPVNDITVASVILLAHQSVSLLYTSCLF